MKRIEVIINGRREEKAARQVLQGIYRAVADAPACTDVSVQVKSENAAEGGRLLSMAPRRREGAQ